MALDPSDADGIPAELIALYSDAELALIALLAEAIADGIDTPEWEARQPAAMLRFHRQAEALAAHLQAQMPVMVDAAVVAAADMGRDAVDEDLGKATAGAAAGRAGRDPRTMARARGAWSTLATVTARIPAVADALYGNVVTQVQVRNREVPRATPHAGGVYGAPTANATRLDAAQQALDILTKRGITGFRDAASRNWSLTSYIEMKSRTIVNQELIDSHTQRMLERGQTLVVVSSHSRSSPQCQPYEGQVLSLDGESGTVIRPDATGGAPVRVKIKATMDEARSHGFRHPNCKHAVSAYIPGASKTFTTKPDPDGYAATQKQRAIERAMRDAKRAKAAAITPQARQRVNARIQVLNDAMTTHLDEWDLKRRRRRETPGHAR